jgi:hypothetical protein
MVKWKKLNMALRARVLNSTLRLEQLANEIVLSILRITKNKTKTLGHSSSSFSFKNKIDLIHDLNDIDDDIYNGLIKCMEIRNQFAHNHNCSYFIDLKEINSEYIKYLKKYFANNNPDEEQSLEEKVLAKLLELESEYKKGVKLDIQKYVNNEIILDLDRILESAMKKTLSKITNTLPLPFQSVNYKEILAEYRMNIMIEKHQFAIEAYDKIEVEDAFKRKET